MRISYSICGKGDEELDTMQARYEQIRAECIRREGATPKH